jgi:hypothetical protein
MKPKEGAIIQEQIEKKGKPALVMMDLARRIIQQQEIDDP